MKEYTLELVQECLANRKRAKLCSRCKGTGLFRAIDQYAGLASRQGNECHQCSRLRKVPLSWTSASNYNRAAFFINMHQSCRIDSALLCSILDELLEFEMLPRADLDEIKHTISLSNELNKSS
jgi:hypothetical protein